MKGQIYLAALATVGYLALGSAHGADEREGRPRFKGIELYSWKDDKAGWVFALLDGTNRLKNEAEVKAPAQWIKGVAQLKKELARLAVGEQVSWSHQISGFAYPPEPIIKEVMDWAKKQELKLYVPDRDGTKKD